MRPARRDAERESALHVVADTTRLIDEGVISAEQAAVIEAQSRDTAVKLLVNGVLCLGILASTGGLIFWLADAAVVAFVGCCLLIGGLAILRWGGELFRIFGNGAALIGAGLLIGGACVELMRAYEDVAGSAMTIAGGVAAVIACLGFVRAPSHIRFAAGAVLLMAVAAHLTGVGYLLLRDDVSGWVVSAGYLYAAALIGGVGALTDVRLATAAAIIPFAQALDTGASHPTAPYAVYSPEPTLSIAQMAVLIVLCLWVAARMDERIARHARQLAILAFVVANISALVGSLSGDFVGESLWGPGPWCCETGVTSETFIEARRVFRESALVVSKEIYAAVWGVALIALAYWAAVGNRRGLFNASLGFAGLHAFTQLSERLGAEPLTFVIGGAIAIPMAWTMWRLNLWLVARADDAGQTGWRSL